MIVKLLHSLRRWGLGRSSSTTVAPDDEDEITEIGIDQDGRLYLRPKAQSFPHVYRAAKEVSWDPARAVLFSPRPREWSHLDWCRHIVSAVADEYGVRLKMGPEVVWSNVPDALRTQIEADRAQSDETPASSGI